MSLKHVSSLFAVLFCLTALSCSTDEPVSTSGMLAEELPGTGIEVSVLSTKPWLVTGGDALVEVVLTEAESATPYTVKLNDTDVTDQFVQVSSRTHQALLSNIAVGENLLIVELQGSDLSDSLSITNYSNTGPIISGPHQQPFVCQSAEFGLVTGELLGPAKDLNCSVDTRIDYVYWSEQEAEFRPYVLLEGGQPPEDVVYLGEGSTTPFIVRVETGTVNRAIYEIAMLHDPANRAPDPWNPSDSWNNKLVYTHGGGCRSGWHQQGIVTGGVLNKGLLEQGFALASSTLNVFGQNCNDLLASETHIMMKEVFIEHYGMPVYTLATGVSGGSYQSHQTADNYPGIFDGIIVGLSFPDVTSATIFTLADSRLLHHYFTAVDPEGFSVEQQQAVAGFGEHASIANLSRGAARLDPVYSDDAMAEEQGGELSVPELEEQRYSDINQAGIRATVYDHMINVFGELDGTDVALRPLDNVGIQYGLAALNDGVISPQQFINLNRDIGGFDRDMEHVSERIVADQFATERAIESGRILFGGAGLGATPIIDYRSYLDLRDEGDIHMIVHQFSTRERLVNANGHADNQVMQIGGRWGFTEESPDLGELFRSMDRWIMAIKADNSDLNLSQKVVRNKPSDLVDACWDRESNPPVKIEQEQEFAGDSQCAELYPAFPTPRHVAGAPLANDVVSCRLRPVSRADYRVELTPEQFIELEQVFPEGVCDWNAPGNRGVIHQGSWLSFGPSPVNRL